MHYEFSSLFMVHVIIYSLTFYFYYLLSTSLSYVMFASLHFFFPFVISISLLFMLAVTQAVKETV